jgi:hypothetical protein
MLYAIASGASEADRETAGYAWERSAAASRSLRVAAEG